MPAALDLAFASRLAQIPLGHVAQAYPNGLSLALAGPQDLGTPAQLHPIFFGSFDWHSCVHSHWLLARLLRAFPDLPQAGAIVAHFDQAFTPTKVAGELAYLARPLSRGFSRPYGWAWMLQLAGELDQHDTDAGRRWAGAIAPLAEAFVERFVAWLPRADYPVRAGVHSNTAFALVLTHDYAVGAGRGDLRDLAAAKARAWHGADRDCQAWEPSGDDFLSPALVEAELMRRIFTADEFAGWLASFLPRLRQGEPQTLFAPARVSDRTDGKIAHLDGLNLSRAWCWRGLGRFAGASGDAALAGIAEAAAERHLAASLPHVAGDYMGEHWLASFALLALLA
ncbi:MAG TPA: DUF2891 domain-containing protein [Caulobacteraceae bacterium]|jgi:hypothetical protein|nr:DUF2891 domain-containing protein [Caulobacteraceae bacterium]